ncbi:NAD(P)/FAD-dependent oxidoreductase [Halostagnicola sp. A-GB9-2]|uniref:dihydrolipoyl dehydrogenase family protein n=1 Tax=Halostagnicola sp. A-GB9-2 TaxID=3048066 RepID=UPI0024BF51CE|nr:NAD(P)/FAD-dependent oxidoreductase [Halostagnicola sp. A-GB9-2]MDJ1432380.1 NAD(P)/FAD-dependent oxidoreductase [Halostagnicola sp. A-GB9-2]
MVHVAIVGAYGSAGVAVADELVERAGEDAECSISDLELTLIDDGEPGGGLCILKGCMPSKDVLSAAQHRYQVRHDDRLEGTPEVVPERVIDQKDEHIHGFAQHRRDHVHELAERDNVEFIHDTAEFVEERVLEVGDRTLEPDYVVIATGSVVNVPDLPGIEDVSFSTSADVLEAAEFPDSAIVMGFGYIGLELVPYLSEVSGVDLTVIEHDERPLDEMEPEYGETILELYREQFDAEILTQTDEKRIESAGDETNDVRMIVERDGTEEILEAEELYLFTGRRPNVDGLGLEKTALEVDEGWVDSTMQARDDERVFVVGDVNGREPILHVAKEQGFAAGENVLRHARGEELEPYTNVPHHVIFSGLGVYPFARIGHTPATASASEMKTVVVSSEASSEGVFKSKNHPEGRATLVVNAEDGSVLGYQGLHLHADVMAKTMQLAVEMALDVREIPSRAYHPTTPEILDGLLREACSELAARSDCVATDPPSGFQRSE